MEPAVVSLESLQCKVAIVLRVFSLLRGCLTCTTKEIAHRKLLAVLRKITQKDRALAAIYADLQEISRKKVTALQFVEFHEQLDVFVEKPSIDFMSSLEIFLNHLITLIIFAGTGF